MAKIHVIVDKPILDGSKLKFRTPCDSTVIEGLEVKTPEKNGVGTVIKKFVFKDAHGTELSGVGNLFVSGVMIEVLLDVTHGVAYIQNADTNSYVESVKGEIQRIEESQKQFLKVAGEVIEDCEDATKLTKDAAKLAEDAASGVVTIEQNRENPLMFWVGTKDEYNAILEPVTGMFYIISDETDFDDLCAKFETFKDDVETALSEKANTSETRREYKTFGELGLTQGSETIDGIFAAMASNSTFISDVGVNNAAIYPDTYVQLEVVKHFGFCAIFRCTQKYDARVWVGSYTQNNEKGAWSGWKQLMNSDHLEAKANTDDTLRVYKTLGELGLTVGSETIEGIFSAMAGNSMLQCLVGASNAAIYPDQYVMLEVLKTGNARAVFRATQKLNAKIWVGSYSTDGGWSGWKQLMNSDHVGATLWTGRVDTSNGEGVSIEVPNILSYISIMVVTANGARVLNREGDWFVGTSTTYGDGDGYTVTTDRIKLKVYTSSIGVFSYPNKFDDTCHVVSEMNYTATGEFGGYMISEQPLVFTSIVGII